MSEIRERSLSVEEQILSEHACLCKNTKGRLRAEEECPIRTAFQRDRDRIIHCNSFRRLKHKTQVFLTPEGDHYRTRLTHTLEVSQIARTIARALRLNEDLTEAIALGHDLGHTPFGHAGERALNAVYPGGFRHYEQSLRVVDKLEKNRKGLNLTYEVRDGIVCHTRGTEASTLEGRIVKLADRIAYINHDIDDAVRAGVMSEDDIPLDIRSVLGFSKSQRINTLVVSAVENSGDDIRLDKEINGAFDELHELMFKLVYTNPVCKSEETKAIGLIQKLYEHFSKAPGKMPQMYIDIANEEGAERAACDYIAGMTDGYALNVFSELFIPKGWLK
ncbi:MAG: deoxyguanosinetriphosphate triphosphohydrolase [Acutalibacteraceae bacterium]|nr:deoxyguanosinetriphosphate triphosphohydrolase [Oscillospiraceae bacterium]